MHDGAGPSHVQGVWYSEASEGPPATRVTPTTKALRQLPPKDKANLPVQQKSSTLPVLIQILADDLCFVSIDLARIF